MDQIAGDQWPRYRSSANCPLCRFEATGQPIYPAAEISQMRCGCTWQKYLSLETNTRPTYEFSLINQSRGCFNHPTSNSIDHTKATKSNISSRGPPTTCHHYGQTLTIDHVLLECAVLQGRCDKYYIIYSLNTLLETIHETCLVDFLWEVGFFYLIWIMRNSRQFPTKSSMN